MDIRQTMCVNCGGSGSVIVWRAEKDPEMPGIMRATGEEDTCPVCNGKGWTTYPAFTTEEAKVIAKHFGFSITGYDADE